MEHLSIDPEEMELRQNQDFIDSLKMVGEGGTSAYSLNVEDEEGETGEQELPRAYQ